MKSKTRKFLNWEDYGDLRELIGYADSKIDT